MQLPVILTLSKPIIKYHIVAQPLHDALETGTIGNELNLCYGVKPDRLQYRWSGQTRSKY